jgi:hypothetical protein
MDAGYSPPASATQRGSLRADVAEVEVKQADELGAKSLAAEAAFSSAISRAG